MAVKYLVPVQARGFYNDGIANAATATRYVGGTASGAPSAGTWSTGDWAVAANGHIWICTAGGTPGTWVDAGSYGGGGTPATSVTSETTYGISPVIGTSTNYARQDHTHGSPATPVTSAVGSTTVAVSGATGAVTFSIPNAGVGQLQVNAGYVDLLQGQTVGGAKTFSNLITASAGMTIPSGQPLTTGTRSVVTGTRATTTNANDTVGIGTFQTTGGAIELRIHAHLAAPAAGTTASVTKVYEVAVGALMGTLTTWYLCLPADASSNSAATNDFALEIRRLGAGNFEFRLRQKSIGVAGSITFTIETLGDAAVTFSPDTTVTANPTAVTALHPSNPLTLSAGNVGIGTDAPLFALHMVGGQTSVSPIIRMSGIAAGSAGLQLSSNNSAAITSILAAAANAQAFGDVTAEDLIIQASTGRTIHLGGASGTTNSTLKVSATDVQINDNGTVRSAPRGFIDIVTTGSNGTTSALGVSVTVLTKSVNIVSGRRYRLHAGFYATSFTAVSSRMQVDIGLTNATKNTVGALYVVCSGTGTNSGAYMHAMFTATATGAATMTLIYSLQAGTGTCNTLATAGNPTSLWIEDIGT